MATPVFPVNSPTTDVGELLRGLIADTGSISTALGGYRIQVHHTRAFPWDDVFKALLSHNFRVYVASHQADLYIEATP